MGDHIDHSDHRKNQTMDASVDVRSRVFDAFRSLEGFTDGIAYITHIPPI
ncbi:hypothetical protein RhiirA4_460323 [Rhizophagus irregularis]|uniref:Uncharacterized protein n=1 Tax=Rhizophagus irregularis TaxID=588596 RepID=A0A2I1GGE4_9GLOM|nr:hypothetical protein RhiirA4_460323 [Rhizophagus irregularis]